MQTSTSTVPKNRGAREERRDGFALAWLAFYRLIFAGGLIVTATYALSPAMYQRSLNGVAFAAVVLALLFALRIAEGAEIAVTMVLDRDDEQLASHAVRLDLKSVRQLRSQLDEFVAGRQFLVVVMVVSLQVMCLFLERAGTSAVGAPGEPQWLNIVLRFDERGLYAFWFPIVAVLVNAQLPSKFAAQQHPMRYFSDDLTQLVIRASILVGSILGLGALVKRFGTVEAPAEPSRLQLYKALAAFRDGVGFEQAKIVIMIDPSDGSVDYAGQFLMKAYGARPGTKIPEDNFWDAAISDTDLKIEQLPAHCGTPSVIGPIFGNDHKEVHWDVALGAPLGLHEECSFHVKYRVAAGASIIKVGDRDFFEYECYKFPVNELSLTVMLKNTSTIALREPTIEVDASNEAAVNAREMERVTRSIVALKEGYRYEMQFPLLPAKYRFSWEIGHAI